MKAGNEIKAGLFVFASFVLIGALILIMGRERQIFSRQSEFLTTFRDVKGLAEGSPVRLGGISIGRVARVGFSRDLSDTRVHVKLLVNNSFLERIRPDSMVAIETQGLLGDRFVSVSAGTQGGIAAPGSTLPSAEVSDFAQILQKAQTAVDNTSEITERINRSLEGLSPETFTNLESASKSISDIFAAIKTQEGFLHRIIYSEKDGARLTESIAQASQDVSAAVREIRSGKGLLHALIFDEGGKQAVESIAKTAHNLTLITDALANGTGTLGALIIDPQLYDSLVEITGGAKRSFLLRQAIRSSLKAK